MAFGCLNPFCYNLLYSEAGAVGAGHNIQGMVVDIWNCSL